MVFAEFAAPDWVGRRRLWLGTAWLLLVLSLPPGAARADITLPFAPPLMALNRQANVVDGGRVEIPLGVSGAAQGNTYEFIIRAPPTKGRLDYLRVAVAGDSAVISYTHNPSLGGGTDSFSYAVQRVGGGSVSAPARVDIRIADAVPRLLPAPDTLDFGIARAGGGRTRRTFTLKNFGGPTAGRIMPSPPWTVEGADSYKLRRGESATFTVVFKPTRAGRFEGALAFGVHAGPSLAPRRGRRSRRERNNDASTGRFGSGFASVTRANAAPAYGGSRAAGGVCLAAARTRRGGGTPGCRGIPAGAFRFAGGCRGDAIRRRAARVDDPRDAQRRLALGRLATGRWATPFRRRGHAALEGTAFRLAHRLSGGAARDFYR